MDDSNQIKVLWFAHEWDSGFIFFPTQAEAIAYVESQVPLHLDENRHEWHEDVRLLRVGCLTHTVNPVAVKDRDYCDYKLVPVLD